MKNNKFEWFALAIAFCVLLAVLFNCVGCNIVNKSQSVEKKSIDSTAHTSMDSSKLLSHDSTSVKKLAKKDSTGHKRIDDKKLILTFDTAIHRSLDSTDFGHVLPVYQYIIGGKQITTPNKITSAIIDDSSEDDSSNVTNGNSSDSVHVQNLDTSHVSNSSAIHIQEQTKTVDKTKESKRTSPWLIGGIILLIIVGGYLLGRKLGFFKYVKL